MVVRGDRFNHHQTETNLLRTRDVPQVGFEPTRCTSTSGFSYSPQFSLPLYSVRSLDFPFTLFCSNVGAVRQVSTPSLSSLARDYHVKGFPEFERFYFKGFPLSTPKRSPLRLPFRHWGISTVANSINENTVSIYFNSKWG